MSIRRANNKKTNSSKLLRIVYAFLALGVLGGIVAGLFALFVLYRFGQGLPDYSQLANYDPPMVSRLYANDGQLLCEYATEKRVFVPIEEIPPLLIHAFLAAEDKNFYQHPGIDFMGIMRAVAQNMINAATDRRLVGASTITQQVVKNMLLTNELSYERKIREAILAFRIEKAFTKDKILELYLNQIYLGANAYGVGAAAFTYFNKSIDQLSIEEAAYLAALPKAPNNYQAERDYEQAKGRRDWVIERMEEERYVSPAESKQARAKPLQTKKRGDIASVEADYFCEDVRRDLFAKYGEKELYEGGLAIHTTLDPDLQRYAEAAFNAGLSDYDRRHGWRDKKIASIKDLKDWQAQLRKINIALGNNDWQLAAVLNIGADGLRIGLRDGRTGLVPPAGFAWTNKKASALAELGEVIAVAPLRDEKTGAAQVGLYALRQIPEVNGGMVVLDAHSGQVLAMVGGFSFGDKKSGQFNRATQAMRQTGSTIKPLVYLTALQNNISPAQLVMDAPISLEQGPGLPLWSPENYTEDFAGPRTMRWGLEQSRNLMTVRLAKTVGMDKVVQTIQSFGIAHDLPEQFAIALGAWETTLLQLTAAYATIADGGKQISPYMVERIQDRRGKMIFKADQRLCDICGNVPWMNQRPPQLADGRAQIVDPQTNYQLISMMQGVIERGTAQRVKALGVPIAGKTGTTNDFKDAWFVAFSNDLVVGVYVGFDQPRSLGKRETGAAVSAPIFIDFMRQALKKYPARPFAVPDGIKFMPVNLETGEPAIEGEPNVILEAFRGDQEWYGNRGQVIDGGSGIPSPSDGDGGGFFPSFLDGVY
jgi:penicillin-binding protein 1A